MMAYAKNNVNPRYTTGYNEKDRENVPLLHSGYFWSGRTDLAFCCTLRLNPKKDP